MLTKYKAYRTNDRLSKLFILAILTLVAFSNINVLLAESESTLQKKNSVQHLVTCQNGNYLAIPSDQKCTPCEQGFLCSKGQKHECPAGYICSRGGKEACGPGYWSMSKSTECNRCQKPPELIGRPIKNYTWNSTTLPLKSQLDCNSDHITVTECTSAKYKISGDKKDCL